MGRRPGRAAVAHVLVLTIANAVLGLRVGADAGLGELFIAALVGGVLMEGLAFLTERNLLRP